MPWQLFVKGVSGKTSVLHDIDPNCSIDDLVGKIAGNQGISADELRVIYGGSQLELGKGQVLSDYKIVNMSTLFIVLRLRGGWNPSLAAKLKKKELTALPGYIRLTTEPCMISFDEDPDTKRAKMPCGHVIAPDSMSQYARSILADGFYIFRCPIPDCHKEWDYFLVRHVAALSEDELMEFEVKLAETYAQKAMGVQQCPGCRSFCMRIDPKLNCVKCPVCLKKNIPNEFCWSCLHPWIAKKKDQNMCGNPHCDGGDPRLRYLRDCPNTEINGVKCPSIRACPSCGILIHHESGCKHMQCTGCKKRFCFVCLEKPDEKGNWKCGSYNSKCTAALVQTQLMG